MAGYGSFCKTGEKRDNGGCLSSVVVDEPSVLQIGEYLTSMSLSIKLDITVVADALAIQTQVTGFSARYG